MLVLATTDDPDFKREVDKYMEGVVGVIDANSFERMCLWERFTKNTGIVWDDNLEGLFFEVGTLSDMPVTLSIFSVSVDGVKILFVDSPSMVVDHRLINQWLDKHLPSTARREDGILRRADAGNAHNILNRGIS